jgi:hypothetical protein
VSICPRLYQVGPASGQLSNTQPKSSVNQLVTRKVFGFAAQVCLLQLQFPVRYSLLQLETQ